MLQVVVDEHGQVVLTQPQEAEFELQLAQVLEAAQGAAGRKNQAALPLELAYLAELLPPGSDGSSGSSSQKDDEDEEEEEEQAPVWKVISTPKAGPKVRGRIQGCRARHTYGSVRH